MESIFDRVKNICEERGVSIYKLEKECKFSSGSICKWKDSSPSAVNLKTVADYFGVSVDYFFGEKHER